MTTWTANGLEFYRCEGCHDLYWYRAGAGEALERFQRVLADAIERAATPREAMDKALKAR